MELVVPLGEGGSVSGAAGEMELKRAPKVGDKLVGNIASPERLDGSGRADNMGMVCKGEGDWIDLPVVAQPAPYFDERAGYVVQR